MHKTKGLVLTVFIIAIMNMAALSFGQMPAGPMPMGDPGFQGDPGMMGMMAPGMQQSQADIICPVCGTKNPAGTTTCTGCGETLSAETNADGSPIEEVEVIPMITVVEGKLILCRITQEVLQEPVRREVPLTEKDAYFNDGTHGDAVADDEIYSNVEIIDDQYISPKANLYRRKLIDLVGKAMNLDPLVFSGLFAASITDFSELDNVADLQINQNNILENYRAKLLEPYRIDPKDPYSKFYPVYFPEKPEMPSQEALQALLNSMQQSYSNYGMMPGGMMGDPAMMGGQGMVPGASGPMPAGDQPQGAGQIGLSRARSVASGIVANETTGLQGGGYF